MKLKYRLIAVTLFAIAMGYLESAVVVYLRDILYPGGFAFPLSPIPVHLALTELWREVATMVMLASVGIFMARKFSAGFAWFIYTFAIWDIFYYVFLKLLLGWPESILTWDVLFLIPTTWTGPVLTPVLVSCTMILLALVILVHHNQGRNTRIRGMEWTWLIVGSLILIVGFVFDYSQHMLTHFSFLEMYQVKNPEVLEVATRYIPHKFPWWLFGIGEGVILVGVFLIWRRIRQ